MIQAPIYPPASRYETPALGARAFDAHTVSVFDLMASPAAKAVLLRELPAIEARIKTPQLIPHLSNFSLQDLVDFGAIQTDRLAEIDAMLRAIPPLPAVAS